MTEKILITGGAGFIGSHLVDELLAHGYDVRVLDNLSPQVHATRYRRPPYLNPEVELMYGDICNADVVRRALLGVSSVFHLAAPVGVGQSMYQIGKYTNANTLGTAILLEALAERPVHRLVVASSMSIYGEGLYRASNDGLQTPPERAIEQLKASVWELHDPWGNTLEPVATPEGKTPSLVSIYALSKYDQERMCLLIGRAYNIPTVVLRFFNVFGIRQALKQRPPLVYTSTNKVYGELQDIVLRQNTTRFVPIDQPIRHHGIGEERPRQFHSP
jgi:dTDP-L-rhamnose 4-epimerase